ncbi:MAG: YdeI/OmpD-associated family protein [Acidimicrobiales bacterium]
MSDLEELLIPDIASWRLWLDGHHGQHRGVWLVLHKKGGKVTTLTYAQALEEALCYGWIDGQLARRDNESYRQRFTPRRPKSAWSRRNVELVTRLSEEGRMQPAGIASVERAKAEGSWDRAYEGQSKSEIPRDLSDALNSNPAAHTTFHQMDAANRYAIIYRLNAVKRPDTRVRKLADYIDMLARGEVLHPRRTSKTQE